MPTDHLDRAGTATSVACAIHCAVSPLILPLLPLAGRHFLGTTLEWTFAALTLALGVASLGHSYRVVHRDARTLALFVTGFTLLMIVRLVDPPPRLEWTGIVAAGSLIVAAHLLNLRLRRTWRAHGGCGCSCHER